MVLNQSLLDHFCNPISMIPVRILDSVGGWLFSGFYLIIRLWNQFHLILWKLTGDLIINSFLIKSSGNVATIFVANLLIADRAFLCWIVLDIGTFHLKQSGWWWGSSWGSWYCYKSWNHCFKFVRSSTSIEFNSFLTPSPKSQFNWVEAYKELEDKRTFKDSS